MKGDMKPYTAHDRQIMKSQSKACFRGAPRKSVQTKPSYGVNYFVHLTRICLMPASGCRTVQVQFDISERAALQVPQASAMGVVHCYLTAVCVRQTFFMFQLECCVHSTMMHVIKCFGYTQGCVESVGFENLIGGSD